MSMLSIMKTTTDNTKKADSLLAGLVFGAVPDWGADAFDSFRDQLLSRDAPFPCVFGVTGLRSGHLRYCFVESKTDSNQIGFLAEALRWYLPRSRSFGRATSFVAFFKPEERDGDIAHSETAFWRILNLLHEQDARGWPDKIPQNPSHHLWEFSFAGEPIFVACATPGHKKRMSRYNSVFMLTFQPRWALDSIGDDLPADIAAREQIRERLAAYDLTPISPSLANYGESTCLEWKRYFLRDTNHGGLKQCPFAHAPGRTPPHKDGVKMIEGDPISLESAVKSLLPQTGAVEVQRDTPEREHKTHTHPTDETLLIVDGGITFTANGKRFHCRSGDRILLPAKTVHSSIAGEGGCLYAISLECTDRLIVD